MSKKVKVILDCDVGHDDAIALMLGAAHPQIDLLGICAVAGNQVLEKTLPNTLNVVQHLELMIPVYAGMDRPMVRKQMVAGEIHGETGLDGPVFGPLKLKEEKEHAVNFIIRTLMEAEEKITLVPVGPLSNIGMALRLEPKITEKIERIVLMGGAYGLGNYTPAAEFNVLADPEAAHVVFSSGVPLVMMGLDLTNQALADISIIERMEALGNKAGKLFGDMMRFTFETQRMFGLTAGPVHDVTAMAYVVEKDIFETKPAYVEVCLDKGSCYGRTVCDFFRTNGREPNVLVGMGLNLARFWDLVEENLRRLP
ncbi:MAG: ribonucleoside hydrolase [Lachnospiraceae bacterium]|jgi:ribosylpyrimidine nucleosidase|nr:ribonucleoside hydrolase [Lachnospiraceae bacterium]